MGKSSGGIRGGKQTYSAAVEEYISGDGMWINGWLRNNTFDLTNEEKRFLDRLDKDTDRPIGKDMTLFRSVDASAVFGKLSGIEYESLVSVLVYGDKQKFNVNNANKILDRVKIGSIQTQKGFLSTTKSKTTAEEWGGFSGSQKPIVMKITAPKSTKGIDLSAHRMQQSEVLIKRNSKYKINKIYSSNGVIYVDVKFI